MRVKMATGSWFHKPGWGASEDRGRLDLEAGVRFEGRRCTLRFQHVHHVTPHRQRLNPRFVMLAGMPTMIGLHVGLWISGVHLGLPWILGSLALYAIVMSIVAKGIPRTNLWVRVVGRDDRGHEMEASFLVQGSRKYSEMWTGALARSLGGHVP